LKDAAEAVKRFIPDAQITFGDEPENCELPWLVTAIGPATRSAGCL
jgi:hypothetical protein